jgi:nitrite reductase (NADH) small subunit
MLSANLLAEENPTWVPVGCIDQIGLGQGRCFRVGPRKLALFRLRDGKVYALDAECPHRRGPLAEGMIGRDTVVCPLHGYKFSLTDGHGLDSDFSIASHPAEVRDGTVYVLLPSRS